MSGRRLSVALLTSARTWRGSGVSLASIAQGLLEHGHRAHMLAGDPEVVDSFRRLGLTADLVRAGNTGWREASDIARILRETAADVMLVDRPRDLRLAALASLAHRVAIVNRYNLSRRRPPRDLLTRLAYRRVALTVFVSETSAAGALRLASYLRRRPHRVINGSVDAGRFCPDPAAAAAFRRRHGLADTPFVLAVGSLTPDKRYDFLMDVWARPGERPPLVVCGEGAHGGRLRARAAERGVNVRFLGQLDADQLVGAYSAAGCFVHAGAVETFGLSVLEAMACGQAVLGVHGGAVPEVLGQAGVIAPVDDPESFGRLLDALLADPARRADLGAAARRRVLERFSVATMRGSYVAALESVGPGPPLVVPPLARAPEG